MSAVLAIQFRQNYLCGEATQRSSANRTLKSSVLKLKFWLVHSRTLSCRGIESRQSEQLAFWHDKTVSVQYGWRASEKTGHGALDVIRASKSTCCKERWDTSDEIQFQGAGPGSCFFAVHHFWRHSLYTFLSDSKCIIGDNIFLQQSNKSDSQHSWQQLGVPSLQVSHQSLVSSWGAFPCDVGNLRGSSATTDQHWAGYQQASICTQSSMRWSCKSHMKCCQVSTISLSALNHRCSKEKIAIGIFINSFERHIKLSTLHVPFLAYMLV